MKEQTKIYVIVDKTDDKPKLRYGVFTDKSIALDFALELTYQANGWNEYTVRESFINS